MAALEACSFQLSTSPPTRASLPKDRRISSSTTNYRQPKRITLSSSSPSPSTAFFTREKRSSNRGARTGLFVCQAANVANQVLEVTDDTWDELVLGSKIPALVDFWAPSCGPCRMVEPVMAEPAKEYAGKIACFKINTDKSLKMASKYGIQSIPTLLFFKDGEKVESITGAVAANRSTLTAAIDKYM